MLLWRVGRVGLPSIDGDCLDTSFLGDTIAGSRAASSSSDDGVKRLEISMVGAVGISPDGRRQRLGSCQSTLPGSAGLQGCCNLDGRPERLGGRHCLLLRVLSPHCRWGRTGPRWDVGPCLSLLGRLDLTGPRPVAFTAEDPGSFPGVYHPLMV